MKKIVITPSIERTTYGERDTVTVEFADPRISGTLVISAMAGRQWVRYAGNVTINGIEYRTNNSVSISVDKVENYALTKEGSFADYASASARETFRKALAEIVAEALKVPSFVNSQIVTEIQYAEYDIERLIKDREETVKKIAEYDEEIAKKQTLIWTNKATLV